MDELQGVGERIAYYRRRRGMTQKTLAGFVGRSKSWLAKIEQGDRTVEAIKDLLTLARVLKIEPGDLLGGIELPPNGGGPLDPPRGIIAVRRSLFAVSDSDEPLDMGGLRAEVVRANEITGKGQLQAAVMVAPRLITLARAAVARELPGAWWSVTVAYHVAAHLARDLSERDLGLLAADRAVAAAERSGDEVLLAVARRDLAFALLGAGLVDEAGAVCSDGADELDPTDSTSLPAWSLWGSLRLTEAIAASRVDHPGGARRSLGDARSAADRVGPERNDYWENFGPANVSAHEIAVELEFGDPVEALRLADRLVVDELPYAGRRARVLIDVAHAHFLREDDAAALAVLLEARRHAAERVRFSVLAHEIVRALLRRERKARMIGLRELAEWMGVKE